MPSNTSASAPAGSLKVQQISLSPEQLRLVTVDGPVEIPGVASAKKAGPAFDRLGIKLRLRSSNVDGKSLIVASPVLTVNDLPLFGERLPVVDTLSLLVSGRMQVSREFILCTCSCGVSGCAGFHDPLKLKWEADRVSWEVPCEGYDTQMSSAFGFGPWKFVFWGRAYLAALKGLTDELLKLEQEHGDALRFEPFDTGLAEAIPSKCLSVLQLIESQAKWTEEYYTEY